MILWKGVLNLPKQWSKEVGVFMASFRNEKWAWLVPAHSLTPQKGVNSFRYFLSPISYCCHVQQLRSTRVGPSISWISPNENGTNEMRMSYMRLYWNEPELRPRMGRQINRDNSNGFWNDLGYCTIPKLRVRGSQLYLTLDSFESSKASRGEPVWITFQRFRLALPDSKASPDSSHVKLAAPESQGWVMEFNDICPYK